MYFASYSFERIKTHNNAILLVFAATIWQRYGMRQRKIRVRRYTDSNRPHLKFVVNYREAGKRKRSFFETEAQAKSFAAFKNDELKRNGIEHSEFPTALRVMAQNAVEQLKPFGKTIAEAVQHYVAYLKANERSCAATQLVKELLEAKKADSISERHLRDIRIRLGKFAEKFDGRMVATITRKEIDDWLRSLPFSPLTRNHYRQLVVLAFNFAVRCNYAIANPAVGAAKAKVINEAPGILSVNETARLLEAATRNILPYLAIGLFAGLRRAELERLDWTEIDFESGLIEVKAGKSKTAQRRFVALQPNLREWLLPLRKHKGNVTPVSGFRQLFEQTREAAGINEWPDNALRHSFASYHLAQFKNAASTALELGHHDSRVTFAHYRELVKPKEAARYWNIRPATREKVVPMVVRA
jgi:integrase